MATGALNAQGVWIYGEDDSNTTFSALLNRLGTSISSDMKGRIVQVVYGNYVGQITNNTNTFVSAGLTASITPTKSTNKVLVLMALNGLGKNGSEGGDYELRRGATVLVQNQAVGYTGTSGYNIGFSFPADYLDSPATTSTVTYTTHFKIISGVAYANLSPTRSTIVLIELAS